MESPTPALETQNLKHWATRKVQITHDFMEMYSCIMSVIIIKIFISVSQLYLSPQQRKKKNNCQSFLFSFFSTATNPIHTRDNACKYEKWSLKFRYMHVNSLACVDTQHTIYVYVEFRRVGHSWATELNWTDLIVYDGSRLPPGGHVCICMHAAALALNQSHNSSPGPLQTSWTVL